MGWHADNDADQSDTRARIAPQQPWVGDAGNGKVDGAAERGEEDAPHAESCDGMCAKRRRETISAEKRIGRLMMRGEQNNNAATTPPDRPGQGLSCFVTFWRTMDGLPLSTRQ